MSWAIGFDDRWKRDIGYGVPAVCDHPKCRARIDRGLAYVCCGEEPYGGELGCGLYFCGKHMIWSDKLEHLACERCGKGKQPFKAKRDVKAWRHHKATHPSWAEWRRTRRGESGKP